MPAGAGTGGLLAMDETRFGLQRRPFRAIPDTDCYYPATGHERILSRLLQAIREDEGLALVTGEPGTGKTLLGHCLLDRLGPAVNSAFLLNSHFPDQSSFLQAILYDLSLPHEHRAEADLRQSLTEFLLKNYEAGKRTVLIIDEAQLLTLDVLEEVRLLGNVEGRKGKAIHVVLLALPPILEALRHPALASFRQRLAVLARLEPLGVHEAGDYLAFQLRHAGGRPDEILSDEAVEILAKGARGIPRLLNRAAQQALEIAAQGEAELVDAEAALEALNVIGLSESTENEAALVGETGEGDDRDAQELLRMDDEELEESNGDHEGPHDPRPPHRLFKLPVRPA
jgi:type II secretory pathway predicted ATPase ExeA